MNVEDWVRDALQELQIQAAEQPITADQIQTGIRYANRLMNRYEYLGMGYTIVESGSDEVTIPPYAEEWAVSALAARMAPQYTPTETLILIKENERKAFQDMLLQHQTLESAQFPPTLPLGSGNECGGYNTTHFYPETDENALSTETNQTIVAEDDT